MLRAVARAARERGWSCELVFSPVAHDREWLDELREDGIPFRVAPAASRPELSRLVRSLLSESDEPTILHSHFTTFDLACALAARRRGTAAVFWHVHTPHGHSLRLRSRNLFKYGVVGRTVDCILCVSTELVDVVTKRGAPRDRVVHAPNAVDTGRFPLASTDDRERARRVLGLESAHRVLVHFGWDWHRKGGDLFCETVSRLRGGGRDVVGVTVGGAGAAEAAGARLGLSPDVLRMHESRDDVRVFYAAADVFMAPSRAEGTPFSVLEALSSGTGVVASEIPGHIEVGRNVPACRLTALDSAALSGAAASLLDRPVHQVRGDAAAAHDWVRQNRDLARWSEELIERYEIALSGRSGRP
jgi:glycosyltransferase involved in cell wall biosynthesis